jgi:protein O-GlcNAc transferase
VRGSRTRAQARAFRWAARAELLAAEGKCGAAVDAYKVALGHWPAFPAVLNNLALLQLSFGRRSEAMELLRRALDLDPSLKAAQSNFLTSMLYCEDCSPEEIAAAHMGWGARFPVVSTTRSASVGDRIRVGYLSSWFRLNPEAFFLTSVLRHHDRARFEVFCYSNVEFPDGWTSWFRQAARWRDIRKKTDEEAAHLIRRDRIDILIDCTGHMDDNRLSLFALKPAPIQVSFPTYPATTGLRTVDYRITDRYSDPRGMTEHLHTERLVRLPTVCALYELPLDAPEPNPLPALANGVVTFGCFNRQHKITPDALGIWASILRRVPGSRLLFQNQFNNRPEVSADFQGPIVRAFAEHGVEGSRVLFTGGGLSLPDHLRLFHEVDICLDTFPFNGMTMTCESLWMGVPVITLAGRSHISRMGVSLLTAARMTDWIAASPEEYVRIAKRMTARPERLAEVRAGLRERMRRSPLLQSKRYIRELERSYLWMVKQQSALRTNRRRREETSALGD